MKTHFKEQYALLEEEKKAVWDDCYVVLDANILLNFYRCSKDTSDDVFNILEAIKDKLWIPYQVVWEYFNNRRNVFHENWNAAKTIKESFKKCIDQFYHEEKVEKLLARNPFINTDELKGVISQCIDEVNKVLSKYEQNVTDFTFDDDILVKITELLEGKVGDDLSEQDLLNIYKEGKKRYELKFPPGYKDNTKDKQAQGERHVYGDLINWQMIINKAKNDGINIVFVSGDQKEDWWDVWNGEKIRPRTELIKEFHDKTGKDIVIYNQHSFMQYAKENFVNDTKDASIDEVKEVEKEQQRNIEQETLNNISDIAEVIRPKYGSVASYPSSIIPDSFSVLNETLNRSVLGVPQANALARTVLDAQNIQNALLNPNVKAFLDNAMKQSAAVAQPLSSIITGFNSDALSASAKWVENMSKLSTVLDPFGRLKH